MIHFLYLIAFALIVSIVFGVFTEGEIRQRALYSLKLFGQFVLISLVLAWVFYFIPW